MKGFSNLYPCYELSLACVFYSLQYVSRNEFFAFIIFEILFKIWKKINEYLYTSHILFKGIMKTAICDGLLLILPATLRFMLATSLKSPSLNEQWYGPSSETLILWSLRVTLPFPMAAFTNSVRFTYSGATFSFTSWPPL